LDQRSQFTDSATLFAENVLRLRRADDDFHLHRRRSNFNSRVAVFREFANEHFVQLGEEDAIGDEFALFGDVKGRSLHGRKSNVSLSLLSENEYVSFAKALSFALFENRA